ncbi:MAG TPA: lysophospholipid acyltransferase family protein [Caulobacteraceae bacterium]
MILLRSMVWMAVFYLWSLIVGVCMIPLFLAPRRWMLAAMTFWARGVNAMIKPICGITVDFRGLENLPRSRVLIAAKHQCMFDTMGPFAVLSDFSYVMKKELLIIPFYGWFSLKTGMIVVDRDAHSKALRKLVADAKERMKDDRQVVIFPEGHRHDPGAAPDYKPGVAALYRELGVPCVPVATNSGVHWPAHGIRRLPGKIVYQFLEPIPPGLHRGEFMRLLQERIETASAALIGE